MVKFKTSFAKVVHWKSCGTQFFICSMHRSLVSLCNQSLISCWSWRDNQSETPACRNVSRPSITFYLLQTNFARDWKTWVKRTLQDYFGLRKICMKASVCSQKIATGFDHFIATIAIIITITLIRILIVVIVVIVVIVIIVSLFCIWSMSILELANGFLKARYRISDISVPKCAKWLRLEAPWWTASEVQNPHHCNVTCAGTCRVLAASQDPFDAPNSLNWSVSKCPKFPLCPSILYQTIDV